MLLAANRYYPIGVTFHCSSYTIACSSAPVAIRAIGFNHRHHRSHRALLPSRAGRILYPLLAFRDSSSRSMLPPVFGALAEVLPLGYAGALLQGIWTGDPWSRTSARSRHWRDFVVCTALSAKVCRWE